MSAFLKGLAIGKPKGLSPLRHEQWILNLDMPDNDAEKCPVPAEMLKQMAAARACAQEMLTDPGHSCLADLQSALKGSSNLLLSMDRSFRCELEWLVNGADEQYVKSIHDAIVQCLPSATADITMGQACIKLDALLESDKAKFASLRSQSEIKTVRKVLDKMATGVAPDVSVKSGGPLFEKVWGRLQYFVIVEIPGNSAIAQCKTRNVSARF